MKNDFILGLDIGITSVGWGIIDKNDNVIDTGVRLFEEANAEENAKRREKRGQRRVKRRRQQRMIDLKNLLRKANIYSEKMTLLNNPYQIRVKGLTSNLTNQELVTALLHIVKRRGSSLETIEIEENASTEDQKSKEKLSYNTSILDKDNKFVCEIQLERLINNGKVRGEENIFRVDDYKKEVEKILENQKILPGLKDKIIDIVIRKRHYSEGPGSYDSPTPYGRYRRDENGEVNKEPLNLIELMRGKCSIYPNELRAPVESFSAELFNFLNDLNNLKLSNEGTKITTEQKQELIQMIKENGYIMPKKTKQIESLSKFLGLSIELIHGFRINEKDKPILTEFKGYQKILKVYTNLELELPDDCILDTISEVLTSYKTFDDRKDKLNTIIDDKNLIDQLAKLNGFTKYHSLSLKAIRDINSEMISSSKNQMEIIIENQMIHTKESSKFTIDEEAILSPVAKRAHRESLKVIDALQSKYGYFSKIVIETTRDKNSSEQRKNIKQSQKYFKEQKDNAEELFKDTVKSEQYVKPNKSTILKLKLYKEQDGKCAYSYNALDLKAIVENRDTYEVDHIIPYSISLDNSLNNKVLCEHKANILKSNKSPYSYFKSGQSYGAVNNYETFKELVKKNYRYSKNKKAFLLNEEDISKFENREDFIQRNLIDTSYAIRTLMKTIKDYYKAHDIPTSVFTVRGKVTNLFRNIGASQYYKEHPNIEDNPLHKDRDQYRHHAIDALIAARLSEQGLIKHLLKLDYTKDINEQTAEITYQTSPLEDSKIIRFVKNLAELTDDDIKFSWKIDTKPNRSFSDETIYSTRTIDDTKYVVKKHKDIYNMTKEELEKKLFKDEKTRKSLLVYQNDIKTFEILEKAYEQFMHEKYPFAAYKEQNSDFIRKYAKSNNGAPIKNLKYIENKLKSHISISKNYKTKDKDVVLLQISPFRTDFYRLPDDSIKFVTIKRADVSQKSNGDYYIDKVMYNSKLSGKDIPKESEFIASFNRNELIEITSKEKHGVDKKLFRFIGTNNDKTNVIELKQLSFQDDKRVMLTVGKRIINVKKISTSRIGEMNNVSNQRLKLDV